MAEIVYILCAATSTFCALLLFNRYRRQRSRLLLLSTLCFLGLAVNSVLLFIDGSLFPKSTCAYSAQRQRPSPYWDSSSA